MKKIRIGVFGASRGIAIAKDFLMMEDCEIVALCDFHEGRRKRGLSSLPSSVVEYASFDEFIEHPMDAVILANYFHEHAPYAIKCLERGIHVYSECISNSTMAEGVELIRAAEKSSAIYMLAENYPGICYNQEMKRICQNGTLGKIMYAEGEYNHPSDRPEKEVGTRKLLNYFQGHWRNYCPRTYYLTHSLGPIMYSTGATPTRVCALAAFAPIDESIPSILYQGDGAAIIMTQNDDGSIFRVTGCSKFGARHNSYRICGERGQVENVRGMEEKVMLRYNAWDVPEGKETVQLYQPSWRDPEESRIQRSGHWGGDYVIARKFAQCIREGKQPEHPFDVHSAVTMSSVAILGHRSMLEGGTSYEIPDFHTEEARRQYENDRLSPFPKEDGTRDMPCCSHPDYAPTPEQIAKYMDIIK